MKDFKYYLDLTSEIGFVEEATNAIVYVSGLPKAKTNEIIIFESGKIGGRNKIIACTCRS